MRKLLNKLLHPCGYELVRYSRYMGLIEQERAKDPEFFFIQIGANDGVRFDKLFEFVTSRRCRGLVVEPVADYFERLVINYRDYPDIIPVNLAIHSTQQTVTIYRVDPKRVAELPSWSIAIGSVSPDHHKKYATPSEFIIEEQVHAVRLMELFRQYDVKKLNLLQIDVEGYDGEIVKMIDFSAIRPHIIRYESKHLSVGERQQICDLLQDKGYSVFVERADTIAVLRLARRAKQ